MGLQLDGKMKQPDFEFDREEVRFSHRFGPFTSVVTPPMVHYAQYKVRVRMNVCALVSVFINGYAYFFSFCVVSRQEMLSSFVLGTK